MTLAELRFDLHLTPEQFGELAGVSGRTIRRLEDEGHRPTPRVAGKIVAALNSELSLAEPIRASDLWPLEKEPAA